jgi:hypothetical protein
MTIADSIWVATALLQKNQPEVTGFDDETILRKTLELDPTLNPRSVSTHLSVHCIASKEANPASLRILTKNPDGTLRLYHEGDPYHPTRRNGRTAPRPNALPEKYRGLADRRGTFSNESAALVEQDPVLAMRGVGKEMWKALGGGEAFIRALREERFPDTPEFNEMWERVGRRGATK